MKWKSLQVTYARLVLKSYFDTSENTTKHSFKSSRALHDWRWRGGRRGTYSCNAVHVKAVFETQHWPRIRFHTFTESEHIPEAHLGPCS